MRQYIIRRLLLFMPTLLLVSILIFLLIRVVPGDAALAMLGEGDFTDDDLERARSYLGLDRPLHIQYYDWIRGILTGDLGLSFQDNTPIGPEIARRMPLTIQLAFLTMIFSLMLAIPIGVISALKQDTWLDYGIRCFSILGLTMPTFWVGTMLVIVLSIFSTGYPRLSIETSGRPQDQFHPVGVSCGGSRLFRQRGHRTYDQGPDAGDNAL